MPTYGRFEILEELQRTALGTVSTARVAGDVVGARFVVKVFDPARMGLLESDAAIGSFQDRAGAQKLLAERGAQHWAPIHEVKPTADGAYYVADHYPLTAQKLLAGNVQPTAKGLHHLISGITAGLLELKVARNRAHGNLKPTNVLIAGKADQTDARVFLADPAGEGGAPEDRTADLQAVGQLIHQLVLRRPFRGAASWPVPESAEWSRLGAQGDRWRGMTNWLLNPVPSAGRPPDLDALAVALRGFAHRRSLPLPGRRLIGAAAVVAAVVIGGALFFSRQNAEARQQLDQANAAWFANFSAAVARPAVRKSFQGDPGLEVVLDELRRAADEGIVLQPPPPSPLSHYSPLAYRRLRRANDRVRNIERALSPQAWKRLGETVALQKEFAARRWEQPAAFLADLIQATRPGAGSDVARGIERLLLAQPQVAQGAAELERSWQQFDADLRAATVEDRTIAALVEYLRRSAVGAIKVTDAGLEGAGALQARLPYAARLAQVVRNGWPTSYARDRLAADVDSQLNLADPGPEDLKKWLDGVDGYTLAKLPKDARPLVELGQALEKLVADVGKQPELTPAERNAFERARVEVQGRIDALRQTRFVRKDLPRFQGDVAALWRGLQTDMDLLRKQYVRVEDPKEWFASIATDLAAVSSQRVRDRWKAHAEALRRRLEDMAVDRDLYVGLKRATEQTKAALIASDQAFPPVPAELKLMSPTLVNAAWERREQQLAALTAWADPQPGLATQPAIPDKATIEAAAAAFGAWCGNLRELAKEFPIRREVMAVDFRPDAAWRQRDPAFFDDPVVQNFVRPDLKRIEALQSLNGESRKVLVKIATDAKVLEIALAAWRRLGTPGDGVGQVNPPWPAQAAELEAERGLRTKLDALVKAIKDEGVRNALAAELLAQGPARWRRFAEAADNEAKLAAAVRLRGDFGVGPRELAALAPGTRLNLALFGARNALTDAGDPVLRAAVAELMAASEPLQSRRDVADLRGKLARVFNTEPMTGQKFVGNTFSLPIPGPSAKIDFVRINPKGLRPFYLSTTEVSIGAFIDLVKAKGSWPVANELMGNVPAGPDRAPPPRAGPQGWHLLGSAAKEIERWADWHYGLDERQVLRFGPDLGLRFNANALQDAFGGNPVHEHPMHHVSARTALYVAGLANCRLPTVREWQIAAGLERQKVGNDAWNLRDETFKKFVDFQSSGPRQWPDTRMSGVFHPRAAPMVPSSAKIWVRGDGQALSDGTLFFRTVSPAAATATSAAATWGAGGTFYNIVGNVAEFTCDGPDAFDGLPETQKRSAAGIAEFAQTAGGALNVIGGSALSAPDLPPDMPYPPNAPDESYADVGFRLAFSLPAKSDAERLKWALDEQPYLTAATERPDGR